MPAGKSIRFSPCKENQVCLGRFYSRGINTDRESRHSGHAETGINPGELKADLALRTSASATRINTPPASNN
jgi:hypothetical protein